MSAYNLLIPFISGCCCRSMCISVCMCGLCVCLHAEVFVKDRWGWAVVLEMSRSIQCVNGFFTKQNTSGRNADKVKVCLNVRGSNVSPCAYHAPCCSASKASITENLGVATFLCEKKNHIVSILYPYTVFTHFNTFPHTIINTLL